VQHRLRREFPAIQDVVVHVEPENAPGGGPEATIPALRALAEELDISLHDITARQVEGAYHVDAHISMDGALSLGQAHTMVSQFEEQSEAQIDHLTEIVTHIEPLDEDRGLPYASRVLADDVTRAIRDQLQELDGPGMCHEVRVYPVGDNWEASLHYVLDEQMSLQEAHRIISQIEGRLRDAIPRLDRVVIHAEPLAKTGEYAQ
jgi:divalent metal cation (Fe/Co/Zn/Cd) transporter